MKSKIRKISLLLIGTLFLGLTFMYISGQQIPNTRRKDMPQYFNNRIVMPDSQSIYFGEDADFFMRYDSTGSDDWLEGGRRLTLFDRAPISRGIIDPRYAAEYFNEFFTLDTTGGMGNKFSNNLGEEANLVIDDGDTTGGILLIQVVQSTPDANGDSILNYQLQGESFATDTADAGGRRVWFEIKVKLNDTTNSSYVFGLFDQDDDSLRNDEASDGIYFEKPAGANALYFRTRESDNLTSSRLLDMVTPTELYRQWLILGFEGNGIGSITPWVEEVEYADSALSINVPWNTNLTPSVEIGSDTIRVDYLRIVQEK